MRNYTELERKLKNILDTAISSGEEAGMQLSVREHGTEVIRLEAGTMKEDSLAPFFSVGKGVMATAFHRLVEKKVIDYETRLGDIWPEFDCNGKEGLRVWHIMTHRGALAAMPIPMDSPLIADWNGMCRRMAEASPAAPPGGACQYHGLTYCWLLGETAHRADGRSFKQIITDEVLSPLGLEKELLFGLTPEAEKRLIPIDVARLNPEPLPWVASFSRNTEIMHGFMPAANGVGNASALSKHYAALIGEVEGVRLLQPQTVENATFLRRAANDPIPPEGTWAKFGLGYALCGPEGNLGRMFGHGGAAGAEGFADKQTGIAVGFIKTRQAPTHPVHPVRDRLSEVLGVPARHW